MHVYTLEEYGLIKKVSKETIRQRIIKKLMPSDLIIRKLPGKKNGQYIIVAPEEVKK